MNYIELHEQYMNLQSIPFTRMSVKERNELQIILKELINHQESSEYDLKNYFIPRYELYKDEIKQIKQCINEQIAEQECKIIMAQNKIDNYKSKLNI